MGLLPAVVERFRAKLDPPNERGCREWNASTTNGYGYFWLEGKHVGAHRVAFFIANGYWAEETRHTCDNPPCCEATHLLDGTAAENQSDSVRRGRHANTRKTHCPLGHPYDEANTYVDRRGVRNCRSCKRLRRKSSYESKRAAPDRGHCPAGHPYDEANTYIQPDGGRRCRVCRAARARERRASCGS